MNVRDKVFCNDNPCQYCNLTKRELKMVQSELSDAYAMLQNRDKKIKELESNLKHMKQSEDLIKGGNDK